MVLQRLRQYGLIARLEAAGALGENFLFIIQFIFRGARVVMLLSLWRAVWADGPTVVSGFTLSTLLTYTLLQEVFAEQLLPRSDIEWALYDGGLTLRFLQPLSLVEQFAAQLVGRWVFSGLFFSLPLFLCAPWLGVDITPATPVAALGFSVSLILTVAVGLALEFIFTALGMYVEGSGYTISQLRLALTLLFSGAVVPLALWPWNLGAWLQWSPFAALASAPLSIYTGVADAGRLLALQVFWAVTLWGMAQWLWRVNREKLVSYGG